MNAPISSKAPDLAEQIKFMSDELGAAGAAELDELARDYAAILATLRSYDSLARELEQAKADNERLKKRIAELELAITSAIQYANGRESEWGDRAESAFAFLYAALKPSNEVGT